MKPFYLYRTIRNRCPRCGEGAVLENLFNRHDKCSSCGFQYSREDGLSSVFHRWHSHQLLRPVIDLLFLDRETPRTGLLMVWIFGWIGLEWLLGNFFLPFNVFLCLCTFYGGIVLPFLFGEQVILILNAFGKVGALIPLLSPFSKPTTSHLAPFSNTNMILRLEGNEHLQRRGFIDHPELKDRLGGVTMERNGILATTMMDMDTDDGYGWDFDDDNVRSCSISVNNLGVSGVHSFVIPLSFGESGGANETQARTLVWKKVTRSSSIRITKRMGPHGR